MRVLLDPKVFKYFGRLDLSTDSIETLRLKLGTGGKMTRQCVLAELARREGATIARRR